MTRADMIKMLRIHLNDEQNIGWEFDDELVEFLDRSVAYLSNVLITMKHNSMMKMIELTGPVDLPPDFISFVGKLPIRVVGNQAIPYGRVDLDHIENRWDDPNLRHKKQQPTWRSPGVDDPLPSFDDLTMEQRQIAYYWARMPYVSDFVNTDDLPYKLEISTLIMDLARMLALNKNEYDVAQDLNLFQQVQAALGSVVKGDEQ